MNRPISVVLALIWLAVSIFPLALDGCSPASASAGIRISGPWDLYYLSLAVDNSAADGSGAPRVSMTPSSRDISDLKKGKYDAVLLGREPTSVELQGLTDHVIAYDAVCFVMDENSYVGGIYTVGGQREHRDDGLHELTSGDVKDILTSSSATGWAWNGGNYVPYPYIDPGSWLASIDSVYWAKTPAQVNFVYFFPAGKFDTQSALYRSLGLDEESLLRTRKTFPGRSLNMEEEILSLEYKDPFLFANEYGQQDYFFRMGFASRRVMTIAPQHVPVRVLSIDGIDPMTDIQAVYNGTYKFSRSIHILVRKNGPASGALLADFLLSPQGQKLIRDVGYLPLVSN